MRHLLKNKALWSLTLGHFAIDLFSGALPIVLLYLKDSLNLSLEQVGVVIGLYSISTSLAQPIFGYFSDAIGGRWFAVGGLLWMSILHGVVGFMPSYETALLIAVVAGFGSAAFHPQGASGANVAAGDRKQAGVAMFMVGGNTGYAVGPLLAGFILGVFGPRGTAVLAVIGLAITPVLYVLTDPKYVPITAPKDRKQANWKIQLNPAFTTVAVLALIGVMSLRATSQSAFTSFVPQYFTIVGNFSNQEAGTLSFLMLGALAAGSFTGGMLADRVGPQRVMVASLLATAPLMAIMILLGDYRAFFIAPILGFASGAAWPPMLVMSQTLFHKNAGVGTGIALGFVFAMGGVGTSLTGWLAVPERMGLLAALLLLAALPLVNALLVAFLPSQRRLHQAQA
ncbi:MAG TPA: MFS transporter [Thermoflexales bacterium]|nr:MFS transporter [Thermoflexales bacterium]HQY24840.1 MFS transporter [Thermoflexales bacterium]HQZ53220.1 MFS transporter [Thermoflexales bacterium]